MYLLASAVGLLASAWGPADGISGEPAGIRGGYFHIFLCKPLKAEYFVDSNYLRNHLNIWFLLMIRFFIFFWKILKKNWEILKDFGKFWEILRDFERFWEILRNFGKFWEIFIWPSNTTFQLPWFPCLWLWEILRNFEKIWEIFPVKIS